MPPRALVLVNADDLGYDPAIDRGILEAHARGLVTAATAMVDTPFSVRILAEAPATLDLGLHAVLRPEASAAEAAGELARQIDRFRALRGAPPTHLDSHRHHHALPALLPAFVDAARREGLPLRALDPAMRDALRAQGVSAPDHFLGDAALRPCWTRERLLAVLARLPGGSVEIMCHPGHAPTHARTSFGPEREVELAALLDPAARAALAGAGGAPGHFADLAAARR
ncbi:MAG TPA: ChbG/HpnK family deacetylase [Anaeromyxobacteraceae bacterium]|nr:ChbG/HpnK family deacetylase [Anaeromyxobacteraceae bacterium]